MKIIKNVLMVSLICVLFGLIGCKTNNTEKEIVEVKKDADTSVERGKYLVTILGCNDCHSTKILQNGIPTIVEEKRLSGYPEGRPLPVFDKNSIAKGILQFTFDGTSAFGPWGISLASNLTPDETGIGNWTFDQFKNALTKGKFKGLDNGRTLNPPMPWPNYATMQDNDVKAIFTYLKSINPVKNLVL